MKLRLLLLAILLCIPPATRADEARRLELAAKLLTAMDAEHNMQATMNVMRSTMAGQLQSPGRSTNAQVEVAALIGEVMDLLSQELTWESLKDEFAAVYAGNFSEEEMEGLIAFYESPTGKALASKQGAITLQTTLITQKRVVAAMPKIQERAMNSPRAHMSRYEKAMKELESAPNGIKRFYALGDAAKESFNAGKTNDALAYAKELQSLTAQNKGDWNYGNAIQDAHLVLGRVALAEGRTDEAKKHLLDSARSEGSPQMNSFGPNMSLAKDLLARGEKEVVLEYFELCRKFWEMGGDNLDRWTILIEGGGIPDFGANLVY
jgi:hypothetical protein